MFMRKQWLALLLATVFVSSAALPAFAQQQQKEKYRNPANNPIRNLPYYKKLRYADAQFRAGSYFLAIEYYSQLFAENNRNPYLTYQLAESFYATRDYVPAAKYYGDAYALAPKLYPEAVYKEAMMLKMQGEYDQSIARFNQFIKDNPKTFKKLKKRAQREIDGANMAKNSVKDPVPVTIQNAGPNVNSSYTESAPLPLGDTSLLFSSMRQNSVVRTDARNRDLYYSRFMTSQKQYEVPMVDSFQWPLAFTDGPFNDPGVHVGNGAYSTGGDRFFFTRCTDDDSLNVTCKIYMSTFTGSSWGAPELLGEGINDEGSNTHPNVAKVGKKEILFFASNRRLGSRGGYDIYYSVIDPRSGTFRRPANCGKTINTEGDEITPYYDARVAKLYFSSNGQVTMGGFDVFSADGGPSRYSNVSNMGYPINTSADDLYYIKDPVGKPDAYVVSNRIGSFALKNPTCCDDIWRIQTEPRLVAIGRVVNTRTGALMPDVVVKMTDQSGDQRTYNSTDGSFLFQTPRGNNYVFTADKPKYTTTRATVNTTDVPRTAPDDTVLVTVYMDSVNIPFNVNNVYYDFDVAQFKETSRPALDSVVDFLRDNPAVTVEIYSHADAKGDDGYNVDLSLRRAESVLVYLTQSGIDRSRMIAKGLGEKVPAAPNADRRGRDLPSNRALNRRTEFRIVSEDPNRRVIFDSTQPGTLDQQSRNLTVPEEEDGESDPESEMGKPGSRVNRDGISQ